MLIPDPKVFKWRYEAGPMSPSSVTDIALSNLTSEREVTWRILSAPAEVHESGRKLFVTNERFELYWPDFRNYVKQARIYDDAAETIRGPSRGLMQYYSALQLAKAELLVTKPQSVLDVKIGHGLSFNPEASQTFENDTVKVGSGIFSLLYEARTGVPLPKGTDLPIVSLLGALPEVVYETHTMGLPVRQSPLRHFMVSRPKETWGLFLLEDEETFLTSPSTMSYITKHYRQVMSPIFPDGTFSSLVPPTYAFESLKTYPKELDAITYDEAEALFQEAYTSLKPLIGVPLYGQIQSAPSLSANDFLPMPPDLARYAMIFYLSSIVRYKPSRLDEENHSAARWLMDSFSSDAGLQLLRPSLLAITGRLHNMRLRDRPAMGWGTRKS